MIIYSCNYGQYNDRRSLLYANYFLPCFLSLFMLLYIAKDLPIFFSSQIFSLWNIILYLIFCIVIFHRRSLGILSLDTVSPEYMFKKHLLTPLDLSPNVCDFCWKFCIMMIMFFYSSSHFWFSGLTFVSDYHYHNYFYLTHLSPHWLWELPSLSESYSAIFI